MRHDLDTPEGRLRRCDAAARRRGARSATSRLRTALRRQSRQLARPEDERFILRRVDEVSRRAAGGDAQRPWRGTAAHRSAAATGPARPGPAVRARRPQGRAAGAPTWPTRLRRARPVGVHRAGLRRRSATPSSRPAAWQTAGDGRPEWVARGGRRGGRRRPCAAWSASSPSSRCRPTRPRSRGTPTEVLARLEELAANRRIAEVKSRLQRMNPVESCRVQPAVRRAGRARGAPPRAARPGHRHPLTRACHRCTRLRDDHDLDRSAGSGDRLRIGCAGHRGGADCVPWGRSSSCRTP